MATKKTGTGTGRYVALRDFGDTLAGDVVHLTDDDAALLMRDGMVRAAEQAEGGDS